MDNFARQYPVAKSPDFPAALLWCREFIDEAMTDLPGLMADFADLGVDVDSATRGAEFIARHLRSELGGLLMHEYDIDAPPNEFERKMREEARRESEVAGHDD